MNALLSNDPSLFLFLILLYYSCASKRRGQLDGNEKLTKKKKSSAWNIET